MNARTSMLLLGAAWLVLLWVALAVRPLLPVDETRYVTVAWEMWLRGDFLVPYLNGEPYSHKPPLLFWLIQAGWWLFGVNDVWPRLVAPLVSLADLALVAYVARLLWPGDRHAAVLAPWLLFGGLVWSVFYTFVQFDLLLVAVTLVGMIGVIKAWQGQGRGWLWLGAGIGLGALVKGPVILIHLLPVVILAPLWMRAQRPASWSAWYLGLLGALALGVGIGMAWAWPAGMAGGDAYRDAIFWGQHAGRLDASADHAQPGWWYAVALPVLLLPWLLWPSLWRGLRRLQWDDAVRFCLAWAVPVVLLLSLVGGKQGKYLLPMLPALALLAARGLSQLKVEPVRLWVPAGLLLVAGLWVLFAYRVPALSAWLEMQDGLGGLVLPGLGLLALWRPVSLHRGVILTAMASVAIVVVTHLTILRAMAPAYDLQPVAKAVAKAQAEGKAVATAWFYHGQYQFLGRLQAPVEELSSRKDWRRWTRDHKKDGGLVLLRDREWRPPYQGATYAQPYRQGALVLWEVRPFQRYRKAHGWRH